jgi:hypothetical protein
MRLLLLVPVLVVLAATGCSDEGGPDEATGTSTTVPYYEEPPIDPELNPDPDTDAVAYGQEVVVEAGRVVPNRLVAIVDNEITFRNDSGEQVVITLRNGPLDDEGNRSSPPIPPGESFGFTPDTSRAITYDVVGATTWSGSIQVDPGTDT